MLISSVLFIFVEGIALYLYAQRLVNKAHQTGYWQGYELGFRTGQTTPIIIRDGQGNRVNNIANN